MDVVRKDLEIILRGLRNLEADIRVDLSNTEVLAEKIVRLLNPPRLRPDKAKFIDRTLVILKRRMQTALAGEGDLTESEMFARIRDEVIRWFSHLDSVM